MTFLKSCIVITLLSELKKALLKTSVRQHASERHFKERSKSWSQGVTGHDYHSPFPSGRKLSCRSSAATRNCKQRSSNTKASLSLLPHSVLCLIRYKTDRTYRVADNGGGMVFGIPIGQCLENDRLSRIQRGGSPGRDEPSELRRKSHHGSRTSFSSLIETTTARGDEVRFQNSHKYAVLRLLL